MINFLDLLLPSASGTIAKSLSESRTKFSSSRRPSGENTGGPQGLELTAWLMDGLRLRPRPKSSKPTLFFFSLGSSCFIFTRALKMLATALNTNTRLVSLVEKWSLFCLVKEIFQCRSLAKAVFFLPLVLPSWSSLWLFFSFMTKAHIHKHIFLSYGILFFSRLCFSLLLTTVSSFCFSHIHCLSPIYNSHRMRPFSLLLSTVWTYVY